MNFSDELNNYLDLLNCSAKDICKASGLSATIVSRYINGKRTPRVDSEFFIKIAESIYELSLEKKINLNKDEIINKLKNSINSNINYDDFINNFNTLIIELKINNTDFAKALGYDSSFISKVRTKSRKPSDLNSFINNICNYIATTYKSTEQKNTVAKILNCSEESLNSDDNYKSLIEKWLVAPQEDNNKQIENFLYALNNFDLNNYIGTDFSKVKVPTAPLILKSNRVFYGKERKETS